MAKKVLAVIRPTNTNCANMLIGAYVDIATNSQFIITRDGSEHKVYEGSAEKYYPIMEMFDAKNRKQYVIDIDMDLPKDEYEEVLAQKKREITAWKKHNQVICASNMNHERSNPDYNRNLKVVNFVLEIPEVTIKKNVNSTKLKGEVFNHYNGLRKDVKRDVALYFEFNPVGLSDDELFEKMCNFENGIIMQSDTMAKYKEIFIDNATPNIDVDVFVRKAIYYTDNTPNGVAPIFNKHGNAYYYNNTYLGETHTDLLNFFLNSDNYDIYDSYIVRRVQEIEASLKDVDKKVVGYKEAKDIIEVPKGEQLVTRDEEEESFVEFDKGTGEADLAIKPEKKRGRKPKSWQEAAHED